MPSNLNADFPFFDQGALTAQRTKRGRPLGARDSAPRCRPGPSGLLTEPPISLPPPPACDSSQVCFQGRLPEQSHILEIGNYGEDGGASQDFTPSACDGGFSSDDGAAAVSAPAHAWLSAAGLPLPSGWTHADDSDTGPENALPPARDPEPMLHPAGHARGPAPTAPLGGDSEWPPAPAARGWATAGPGDDPFHADWPHW